MGFKRRLMIAFLLIIMIPVILIAATGAMIMNYQLAAIQEAYNVDSDTLQVIANPLRLLSRTTSEIFMRIKQCSKESPWLLENEQYLEQLNHELSSKYSFLIVKRDDEYVYVGDSIRLEVIEESLPDLSMENDLSDSDSGIYVGGKVPYLTKQISFVCDDGAEISVYIVTDVNNIIPQIKMSATQAVVAFGFIILITAVILVVWLYRSVISPLNVLREATRRVKGGDLNFKISGDPDDELGQLCEDFEEMRIHLKELIDVQMQYEHDTTELISNISHDLKTPLTAIKGYAEGLLDGVADTDDKRDKYIRTIYSKASDMTSLVEELALYSKIDFNKVPYNFNILDVDAYFSDCAEELSLDMEVKNVTLRYSNTSGKALKIMADAEQLKRVINNVIGNAVKYMDKQDGEIELRVKSIASFVQIEIADNGMGISSADLPLIFDRFYRADASRNSKKGGSGLGLAIAKKVIEDHGGQIWALSDEGKGTTIIFIIPEYIPDTGEDDALAEIGDVPRKNAMFFGKAKTKGDK